MGVDSSGRQSGGMASGSPRRGCDHGFYGFRSVLVFGVAEGGVEFDIFDGVVDVEAFEVVGDGVVVGSEEDDLAELCPELRAVVEELDLTVPVSQGVCGFSHLTDAAGPHNDDSCGGGFDSDEAGVSDGDDISGA